MICWYVADVSNCHLLPPNLSIRKQQASKKPPTIISLSHFLTASPVADNPANTLISAAAAADESAVANRGRCQSEMSGRAWSGDVLRLTNDHLFGFAGKTGWLREVRGEERGGRRRWEEGDGELRWAGGACATQQRKDLSPFILLFILLPECLLLSFIWITFITKSWLEGG